MAALRRVAVTGRRGGRLAPAPSDITNAESSTCHLTIGTTTDCQAPFTPRLASTLYVSNFIWCAFHKARRVPAIFRTGYLLDLKALPPAARPAGASSQCNVQQRLFGQIAICPFKSDLPRPPRFSPALQSKIANLKSKIVRALPIAACARIDPPPPAPADSPTRPQRMVAPAFLPHRHPQSPPPCVQTCAHIL